jgi:tRNA G46 methylase TrmB
MPTTTPTTDSTTYRFTQQEFARLYTYKLAVRAGFYRDTDHQCPCCGQYVEEGQVHQA